MTGLTLTNMHHNAKKAESTNEEILELIGKLIKEGFPKKVTIDEISDIADRHFNGIRSILLENKSSDNSIRKLFLKKELQDELKHLFLMKCEEVLKMKIENGRLAALQKHLSGIFNTNLQSLSEEEYDDFYKIFDQYGKTIKDQDSKSISVFKAIKLFFQEMITKLKSKNLEDLDGKCTVKVDNAKFYVATQTEPKQEVLEQKVDKSPTLETIPEEDEGHNVEFDYVRDVHKDTCENVNFSVIPQFAQEEALSKPQVAQIREKPAIPLKSQKVIDAGNRIKGSQKTETPNYVSQFTVNLKSAGEKPKTEKQYGKNVANMVQRFESLSSNTDHKSEVKSNVKKLIEGFEAKSQEAAAGRSR